jgi:hypothetical protein
MLDLQDGHWRPRKEDSMVILSNDDDDDDDAVWVIE